MIEGARGNINGLGQDAERGVVRPSAGTACPV